MSTANQVIVFDIWSSYAYFRRPYTTTSALTFNFIPRSAIEGVIGAILGIDSSDLYSELKNSEVGVGILNEVKKMPFSTMHIHSDFWHRMREYLESRPSGINRKNSQYFARVNLELIVKPMYRIYFADTKFSELLEKALILHRTKFTPYLGTSTMIANFAYVGTFDYVIERKDNADVFSIIPYKAKIPQIVIEKEKYYAIEEDIPARINRNRELESSYSAVYSPNAQTIKMRNTKLNTFKHKGSEHNFVFLPS